MLAINICANTYYAAAMPALLVEFQYPGRGTAVILVNTSKKSSASLGSLRLNALVLTS